MARTDLIEFKDIGVFREGPHVPEFKAQGSGKISGYGAVFGNVDRGFDMIEPGAFSDSLKANPRVKMLRGHDPERPIGVWDDIHEDEKGLRVEGRILKDVQDGREALALIEAGAFDGLSIGYRTISARNAQIDGKNVRVIERAELWEVSLVTFPMNPEAVIDAVKAASMDRREFERQLLRDSKLSRQVVGALMRGGWKSVQALRDSGEDDLEEMVAGMLAATLRKSQILRS